MGDFRGEEEVQNRVGVGGRADLRLQDQVTALQVINLHPRTRQVRKENVFNYG